LSLILLPSPTADQAVLNEVIRRRGNAVELMCGCCRLPFSEVLNGRHHTATNLFQPEGLNIYSRHYGRTHANKIKMEGVDLIVTDRREFVIVPSADVIERLKEAA